MLAVMKSRDPALFAYESQPSQARSFYGGNLSSDTSSSDTESDNSESSNEQNTTTSAVGPLEEELVREVYQQSLLLTIRNNEKAAAAANAAAAAIAQEDADKRREDVGECRQEDDMDTGEMEEKEEEEEEKTREETQHTHYDVTDENSCDVTSDEPGSSSQASSTSENQDGVDDENSFTSMEEGDTHPTSTATTTTTPHPFSMYHNENFQFGLSSEVHCVSMSPADTGFSHTYVRPRSFSMGAHMGRPHRPSQPNSALTLHSNSLHGSHNGLAESTSNLCKSSSLTLRRGSTNTSPKAALTSLEGANGEVTSSASSDKAALFQRLACQVCGDRTHGVYFGAVVCLPCKSFFIRYTNEYGGKKDFRCAGRCPITVESRATCKHCRYQKCLDVGMVRKERPEIMEAKEGQQLCRVCGDISNGVHFGIVTCEGCKKFFRRGLREADTYACKRSRKCVVNPRTRNECRYCRFQKCLSVGMSKSAIKMGRPRKTDLASGDHSLEGYKGQDSSSPIKADSAVNLYQNALSRALDANSMETNVTSTAFSSLPGFGVSFSQAPTGLVMPTKETYTMNPNTAIYEAQMGSTHPSPNGYPHPHPHPHPHSQKWLLKTNSHPDVYIKEETCSPGSHHQPISNGYSPSANDMYNRGGSPTDLKVHKEEVEEEEDPVRCATAQPLDLSGKVNRYLSQDSSPVAAETWPLPGLPESFLYPQRCRTDSSASNCSVASAASTASARSAASSSSYVSITPDIANFHLTSPQRRLDLSKAPPSAYLTQQTAGPAPGSPPGREASEDRTSASAIGPYNFQLVDSYWLQPCLSSCTAFTAAHHDFAKSATASYGVYLSKCEEGVASFAEAFAADPQFNIDATLKSQTQHQMSAWITYLSSLPVFTELALCDVLTIIKMVGIQGICIAAATRWYCAETHSFSYIYNFPLPPDHPDYTFRESLLQFTRGFSELKLDLTEAALTAACIALAADIPNLVHHDTIQRCQMAILDVFTSYVSAKYGPSSNRIRSIFAHIPRLRRLGAWHSSLSQQLPYSSVLSILTGS